MVKGHGNKPPNPQKAVKSWGKKPPAPPPHSTNGKGACERSIIGQAVIRTVNLLDYCGVLGRGTVDLRPHSPK